SLSSRPRLEAVRPLPRLDATPPVTKRCFVETGRVRCIVAAKIGLPWSLIRRAVRLSTGHQDNRQQAPGPHWPRGPVRPCGRGLGAGLARHLRDRLAAPAARPAVLVRLTEPGQRDR